MSTNYPGSIDSFENPEPTSRLNSATVPHAQQHANANDAIEAIQTALGTNPFGSFSTVKDRIFDIEDNLGTISSQDSDNVDISGGQIQNLSLFDGITIDGGVF